MKVELLDSRCKLRDFEIPKGYTLKTKGDAVRGDLYWNWPTEGWIEVKDSHTFLYQSVKNVACVITPEKV